jgi:hypothetical protein
MRFLRRAREAGQPPPSADDIYPDYVTPGRAAQWRAMNTPETVQPPAPASRELTDEETRWNVRGEPRTKGTFASPHPADFPGGLPLPLECPLPAV